MTELNEDLYREFFLQDPELLDNATIAIKGWIEDFRINTDKLRVVDLCAGNGAVAHVLVNNFGVNPSNVTLIDQFSPNPPLVVGCTWIATNLFEAAKQLERHRDPIQLPGRDMFDLVTCNCPNGPFRNFDGQPKYLFYLANYLLDTNRFFFLNPYPENPPFPKQWQRIPSRLGRGYKPFFFRKKNEENK